MESQKRRPVKGSNFYADQARRDSEEVEYGRRWVDSEGNGPYEVNWLVATGEVFAFFAGNSPVDDGMNLPNPSSVIGDILGGLYGALLQSTSGLPQQVVIFGTTDRTAIDDALEGWPEMEGDRSGFAWLSERLTSAAG